MQKLTLFLATSLMIVGLAGCNTTEETNPLGDPITNQDESMNDELLAKYGEDEGYTVTETNLRYKDTTEGDGDTAEAGDRVTVHYTGTLEDGTEFDSSRGGQPATFVIGVGNLIAGWDEGIPGMQVGDIRELVIPPSLGYGETGIPGVIPQNAVLFFEVELMGIE
jgi:peptidylprolyl isomerase